MEHGFAYVINRVKVGGSFVTNFGPISNRCLKSTIQLAKFGWETCESPMFQNTSKQATGG